MDSVCQVALHLDRANGLQPTAFSLRRDFSIGVEVTERDRGFLTDGGEPAMLRCGAFRVQPSDTSSARRFLFPRRPASPKDNQGQASGCGFRAGSGRGRGRFAVGWELSAIGCHLLPIVKQASSGMI